MNSNKSAYVVGLIAVIALFFGVTSYTKSSHIQKVAEGPQGEQGIEGRPGAQGAKGDKGDTGLNGSNGSNGGQTVGAVSGPDFFFPYFAVNNNRHWYDAANYNTGTSTFCVFKSPTVGSTTLVRFTGQNNNGTSTNIYMMLEKMTRPYAPSLVAATSGNVLASSLLPASSFGSFVSTTSATDFLNRGEIFAPGTFAVLYAKGPSIPAATTINNVFSAGTCTVEWAQL